MTSKANKNFFKNFTPVLVRDKPLPGHTSSSTEIILISINVTGSRLVASRTDKSLRIWRCLPDRASDPIIIEDAHTRSVELVSWNPQTEHSFASVGRDEHIKIWKGLTGTLERQIKVEKGLGQADGACLKIVAYSNDGKVLAVVDRDSTVLVYSVEQNYQKVAEFKIDEHIYDLKWFNYNHGYFVLALNDGTLPVYALEDEGWKISLKSTLTGHRSAATTVSVDPRGAFVAVGSNEGTLSIWNTATMLNTRVITGVDEAIACVDASRDGTYITASYDRGSNTRVFEVESGEEVYEVQNSASGQLTFASVVWFPNKTAFAYSSDHGTTIALTKKPSS
ncbi:WD40 repeat-like protein [Suhomyces tanzawaensis NRRL Y-17324]|uniref:WD40 repeat-like protein n=1 Tax=Suhomyces tanzawaensis NRRL Y-17324 TaxID=984487 RepID=A0A1E4SQ37_9ASCO|nr:WD40 repeat-like protein [Suhomyces tanzawaensis NRRL Y-17324]ODV81616.1 WD40 repeat-like protein [Suhomyces tanzawaensis NRRL Y-17324]